MPLLTRHCRRIDAATIRRFIFTLRRRDTTMPRDTITTLVMLPFAVSMILRHAAAHASTTVLRSRRSALRVCRGMS